ncbi:hypothetical protein AAFF_G00254700 [Aldrovandia affinis]|uniref:Uncharacterized protein n=1 Tax=Aldrovandia affinis TaxID=143900 RepID=A0AAD7W2E5_9TELE|nr:hypothetical protein AAFF_G00254700 [Aldrovandia affinis]
MANRVGGEVATGRTGTLTDLNWLDGNEALGERGLAEQEEEKKARLPFWIAAEWTPEDVLVGDGRQGPERCVPGGNGDLASSAQILRCPEHLVLILIFILILYLGLIHIHRKETSRLSRSSSSSTRGKDLHR